MNEKNRSSKETPQIMVPYGYMPHCPQEEEAIDLQELWQTLKKRKKIILSITLLSIVTAIMYLLIASPKYEAKATIKIGHFTQGSYEGSVSKTIFEDAKQLKREIDIKYDTAGQYRDKNVSTYIKSANVPKKNRDFLTITAYAPDNSRAIEMLMSPIDEIINRHESYRKSILNSLKERMNQLEEKIGYYRKKMLPRLEKELDFIITNEIASIEQELYFIRNEQIPKIIQEKKKIEKEIETKRKEIEKALIASISNKNDIYTSLKIDTIQNDITRLLKELDNRNRLIDILKKSEIPKLEAKRSKIIEERIPVVESKIDEINKVIIPELEAKIDNTKLLMTPPYLEPTRIVGKIYTLDHPVKPKKALVLALSLITGVILGVFTAFIVEFIGKKDEE